MEASFANSMRNPRSIFAESARFDSVAMYDNEIVFHARILYIVEFRASPWGGSRYLTDGRIIFSRIYRQVLAVVYSRRRTSTSFFR